MKEVVFVVHQMGTQGSYLNHLDLQQYLKDIEGYKVRFYCENVKKLFEVIKNSRRSYTINKGEVKILRKEIIEPEMVITDFKSLITLKQLNSYLTCKKLLVMDSIELTYHLKGIENARFFHEIDLYDCLKHIYSHEVLFLMPPNNYHIFKRRYPDLKSQIFFKKINVKMLETLSYENRDGFFFRWDDTDKYKELVQEKFGDDCFVYEPEWIEKVEGRVPLKYNESEHIFDYQNLIYRRRKYLEFQEQFGRLIFEYILLGKNVFFIDEPYTNDGLTDYLKHYEIKFNGNKISTSKKELAEKMSVYNERPWNYET